MDKKKTTETLCTVPWNHVAVYQNGEYGICCQCIYNAGGRLQQDDKIERVDQTTINNLRNHPMYVELRRSMLNGEKHSLCKLCWDDEELGKGTKRQNQITTYQDVVDKILASEDKSGYIDSNEFPINYIDLRLGNLCNLACHSCGPNDSSLWLDYYEWKDFGINNRPGKYDVINVGASKRINSNDFVYYKTPEFKNFTDKVLPTTNRIYFTGGEPLINKRHYDILDFCIENDLAKNITLEYNTNGTTVNKNLLEQWRNFKAIEICFSVDAMGLLANYVRFPSNWDNIIENLRLIDNSDIDQITGTINTTVSILNVMQFPEYSAWHYKQNFKKFKRFIDWNRLIFPVHLNVQVLPHKTKMMIVEHYNEFFSKCDVPELKEHVYGIIYHMIKEDKSKHFFETVLAIHKQDKLRNQSYKDHVPWLEETFSEFFDNEQKA